MIVDDEIRIRNGLEKLISGQDNYEIVGVFADAFSLLRVLDSSPVDVIITDIRMPAIDGLELIRNIREKNTAIKIIILSGYGNFNYAQEAIKLGVYRYLLKPTNPKELLSVLKELESDRYTVPPREVDDAASTSVNHIIIQRALQYIEVHYNKKINLREIAKYLHISPNYFCDLFKKHLNKTFVEYVNDYRIEKSKLLLKDIALSISEVSQAVGYSESKYFCNIFKKKTGITPTEYRNSL